MDAEQTPGPSSGATLENFEGNTVMSISTDELGLATNQPLSFEYIPHKRYVVKGTQTENDESTRTKEEKGTQTEGISGIWEVQDVPLDLSLTSVSASDSGSSAVIAGPSGNCAKRGEKFKEEETSALLKAIAWMGLLRQRIDGLPVDQMCVEMFGDKYWIEDFKGNQSLLQHYCKAVGYHRNLQSLKRKWKKCFSLAAIGNNPKKYFEKLVGLSDEERKFLEKLLQEYREKIGNY